VGAFGYFRDTGQFVLFEEPTVDIVNQNSDVWSFYWNYTLKGVVSKISLVQNLLFLLLWPMCKSQDAKT